MNFAGISVVLVGCSVVHSEKVEAIQLKYSIFLVVCVPYSCSAYSLKMLFLLKETFMNNCLNIVESHVIESHDFA